MSQIALQNCCVPISEYFTSLLGRQLHDVSVAEWNAMSGVIPVILMCSLGVKGPSHKKPHKFENLETP